MRNNQMMLFLGLLLVHLLYDFHWQGPFISQAKSKYDFLLGVHALTWALLLGAVLFLTDSLTWWQLPFLFVGHFVIDRWKSHKPQTPDLFWLLYVDQALHLLQIIIVAMS